MRSWKKLTALLLAGVLAGSAFTGCGKQSSDSSSQSQQNQNNNNYNNGSNGYYTNPWDIFNYFFNNQR